jgi:phospholipid/cholesterol/gamma-HCH transport system permease protein
LASDSRPILGTFFEMIGQMTLTGWSGLSFIGRGRISLQKTLAAMAAIGYDSLPMSLLISLITGSVITLQTAEKFSQTGADAYIGGVVALAVVRELAPIFTCLAVGARAGTAISAEIANMKVSNQIDALHIMHVNPVRYLVVPRLIACVLSLPMLTVLGEVIAIVGGMLVARFTADLHYYKYMESIWLILKPYDIWVSLVKAFVFGILLAIICCTIGLTTTGGARDVGKSTTRAAVWTAIAIIIFDFFLTWIFFGSTAKGDAS